MNIMFQDPPSRACGPISVHGESQESIYGLSNRQMGIKYSNLQGKGLDPGLPAKPSSDTMLNDQLS